VAFLKYAVLGFPVRHSVSPPMQSAAFAALRIPASYQAIEVAPAELPALFRKLREEGYSGWNLTVPHKEQALTLVDEADDEARLAGSVNTVVVRDGRTYGYSTDGSGMLAALEEVFHFAAPGRSIVILGCGGAGRAVGFAFARQGARELVLVNRTAARAAALATGLSATGAACAISCLFPDEKDKLAAALARAHLLIQATSLGLKPADPLPLDPSLLPSGLPVMDMIYRTTPFLAAAARHGCRTADGRWMLLHQGARSFTLWTGQVAPLAAMRRALLAALDARQAPPDNPG